MAKKGQTFKHYSFELKKAAVEMRLTPVEFRRQLVGVWLEETWKFCYKLVLSI